MAAVFYDSAVEMLHEKLGVNFGEMPSTRVGRCLSSSSPFALSSASL